MHTHTHTYRQAHTYTHMQRVRLGQKIQLYLASARKLCSANSWHFNYIRMDIQISKYIYKCVFVCVCVRTCGPALCFEIEKLKNQIQGKPLEPQQLQLQLPSSSLAAAAAKAATAAAPVARSAQRRLFGASGGRH